MQRRAAWFVLATGRPVGPIAFNVLSLRDPDKFGSRPTRLSTRLNVGDGMLAALALGHSYTRKSA
jgi:hypothetical protein